LPLYRDGDKVDYGDWLSSHTVPSQVFLLDQEAFAQCKSLINALFIVVDDFQHLMDVPVIGLDDTINFSQKNPEKSLYLFLYHKYHTSHLVVTQLSQENVPP
jgi:hypothetical protein